MTQDSNLFGAAAQYWTDAWQRGVLFLETLNERGNIQAAQAAKEAPHVLSFAAEVVLDGRTLERPVNYLLVRIVPPADVTIDPAKPPVVVVDPRAGHGPGIGGMKPESEIGVALRAGHAVYFIGFLPKPVPGQTIGDVCRAEAFFLEEVAKRHPEAEGKPIVIANCQAGWQMMMTAAVRPELAGVIMLAGAPLSYWAGVRGKNPMRYLGGTLGGTWLTALAGDMGAGTVRRREPRRELRVPQSRQYLLDQALQRLFQGRLGDGALSRVRDLVGQPGAVERGRDAVDRRQPVRRQQALDRRDPHLRRRAHRSAQHQVADRLLLLLGRRHHPAAAGAGLDPRPLRRRERDRRQRADDHLFAASQHRAPRHLRLRQSRGEGASESSSPAWR